MAAQSIYQPLDTIRLFKLSQDPASRISGQLLPFALNSPSRPDFDVISYVWGPATYSKAITINGTSITILESIHQFLSLLPSLDAIPQDAWWWIDSICINQTDFSERSAQVAIMGKIYKAASRTIVWLGPTISSSVARDTQDCSHAISALHLLHQKRKEFTIAKSGELDRAKCQTLRSSKSGVNWKAIECLLLRPWWRRVWTLQEFIIADNLEFYCGEEHIGRGAFQAALYCLSCTQSDSNPLVSPVAFSGAWHRRRLNQWYGRRPQELHILSIMAFMGDCGATDDLDRIYAFLSLACDASLIPKIDYEIDVNRAYLQLVASFISSYRSLDIICFAQLFKRQKQQDTIKTALPSWVPDWRTQVVTSTISLMVSQSSCSCIGNFRPLHAIDSTAFYAASGNFPPRSEIINASLTLISEGIFIDTIDGLGGSRFIDGEWRSQREEQRGLQVVHSTSEINIHGNKKEQDPGRTQGGYSLLQTISRCLVLDREDRYLNNAIEPHQFFDDFVYCCRAALDTPEDVHPLFLHWFELNKFLSIRGRTLANDCRKPAGKILGDTPNLDDMSDRKGFLSRFRDTIQTMCKRLVVTENGHVGMAPCAARKGDVVCVLFGCSVPVVLRKRGFSEERGERWEFVGECYLHTFMNGEAVERLGSHEEGFKSSRFFIE